MATDRQVEANRRNAARSKGPKSDSGKSRSRANATKHGMAGASAMVEPGLSDEFRDRRAKWAAEYQPAGQAGGWALDRAVAASLRIEICERAVDQHIEATRQRARLAWDQDRAIEAATIAARLSRDPLLASRQLEATWAGVGLLIDSWYALVEAVERPGGWTESEASKALDLLGVGLDLRVGWTPIEAPEGDDPAAFRRALVLEEVDRLEALRDQSLAPLETMEHSRAMAGGVALFSKPAKLILRYERDAWRRYRDSIRQVRDPEPTRAEDADEGYASPTPSVKPPAPPATPARPAIPGGRDRPEEAAKALAGSGLHPLATGIDGADSDRRLRDLQRWLDDRESAATVPIEAGLPARD